MVRITGVDLDWQRKNGRLPTFDAGSPLLFSSFNKDAQVHLPDCDESYAIMGKWLLDGIALNPVILTKTKHIPISNTHRSFHFVEVPGYELVVSTDPFLKTYTLCFVTKHR